MRLRAALLLACALAAACEDPPAAKGPDTGDRATAGNATAERLVTLAPHLTELVFAAGAGGQLVGVSAYSDFPAGAAELAVVSDAFTVDLERLAIVRPTILLAWESGTPRHVVEELRATGYRVETIRTRGLDDVASALERIGGLSGQAAPAAAAAETFRNAFAALGNRQVGKPPITVFYQVSARPLYTIGDGHYIEEIVQLCGGRNVFADIGDLAPSVTVESVVARNPEVALAGAYAGDPFAQWRRWPGLAFNRYANRFTIPADEIGRATPRLIVAAEAVCRALDEGRANIQAKADKRAEG